MLSANLPFMKANCSSSQVFEILKINLSRPFVLSFTEPILWFWNAYIAVRINFVRSTFNVAANFWLLSARPLNSKLVGKKANISPR
jgi:hypothetical protein